MKRRTVLLAAVTGLSLCSVVTVNTANALRSAVQHSSNAVSVTGRQIHVSVASLPTPKALKPYRGTGFSGEGVWHATGRLVAGHAAVYTTSIRLPGTSGIEAGVAWMDTKLLRARLYSGSLSPGGTSWKYTAPVSPSASSTLVAAFNGGFLMKDTKGGYFSEGRLVAPLRVGGASLVIYRNGYATVGQWGRDVGMTSNVVAVRQNLTLLVEKSRPVRGLNPADTASWGSALGQVVNTWRSGLGVTRNGALVYVVGQMNIVDLAEILVRAGAVRAMTLDMNPFWTVFATFSPRSTTGLASAANGKDLLATMEQPPGRFFESWDNRDFITMSLK